MPQANYAGVWQSDFGTMDLKVDGSRVTGTYGPNDGRLEGVLSGNCINGSWKQSAPCAGGKTWGSFCMTFSPDGQSFACRWQYQDNLAPGWGNWYGRRDSNPGQSGVMSTLAKMVRSATASRPPTPPAEAPSLFKKAGNPPSLLERLIAASAPKFDGTWDTDHGEMVLKVNGNSVTGTYGPNGGCLEGVIAGNQVRGTWRQVAPCACGMSWGVFTLTLSADGHTFNCEWQYSDEYAPGGGNWYGRRE
jgi:hypothetical protein